MAGEDNFSLLNPGFSGKYSPDGLNPNRKPAKPRSAPAAQAAPAAAVDPFAQFLEMFSSFGGGGPHPAQPAPHQASGPSEAELAQTQGENDLQSLYGDYTRASEDATTYVNKQIAGDRSNAALLGVNYSITEEQKTTQINDYFSTLFSADDYQELNRLNDEFNPLKGLEDDPYTFLVTRGVTADPTAEDATGGTSNKAGGSISTNTEEDTLGTNSILGG